MQSQVPIAFWGVLFIKLSLGDSRVSPYVAWSMDNSSGKDLLPEPLDKKRWIGDLSRLTESSPGGVFCKGVKGRAIVIHAAAFTLAKNLSESECVLNPGGCSKGISVSFWIRLRSLGNSTRKECPVIHAYSGLCRKDLFVSLANSSLTFRIGGNRLSVDIVLENRGWTHVGVSWDNKKPAEVNVYVNGSKYGRKTATENDCLSQNLIVGNLIAGVPGGASFDLDELQIYYEPLSPDDIAFLAKIPANSTSVTFHQHSQYSTRLVVLATVVPAMAVIICVAVTYSLVRKRRTRKTFRLYIRQSSRNPDHHTHSASSSDSEEDRTDLDSVGEMENLQQWFQPDDV